ncbi:FHA domain-containing protein [Fimbriiglobus ruber]|uniref:FHA domain-containing protein n=1 Tax=Fimbriiglobus ruber TaxID=1908690 RepID=A0A225D903_9BACT|nr:FHA domain-containing protein [Fimbriiglobus ruber]OWK37942.1 hypothetical protein FRUB_07062 [Fimbriiglobus ruber]
MPTSPWLTLRQAREALGTGQPDEAHRLLEPLVAEGYRKAVRLTRDVAKAYRARAERVLRADQPEPAWRDLLAAETLNTGDAGLTDLRTTLTRLGLAECRAALEAGRPVHVIETAARLADRGVRHPDLPVMREVAGEWILASEQADRGDFLLAKDTLGRARARAVSVPTTGLDQFLATLDRRHERFRIAVGNLNDACDAGRWGDALRLADAVVAAAPDHRDARDHRARAWAALQSPAAPAAETPAEWAAPDETVPLILAGADGPLRRPAPRAGGGGRAKGNGEDAAVTKTWTGVPSQSGGPSDPGADTTPAPLPKRFLLWIDGAGQFLVCMNPRVTFGQAGAGGPIDIPVHAELARLHAEVFRDGEGYVLESANDAQVNGAATSRAVLRTGDRISLGPSCQLVFHRPVPISPSARLEIASGHRLSVAVDGVLLMAEALILGPGPQVHAALPDAPGNVVLYRSKDGLGVRCPGAFSIDNRPCRDRAPLPLPSVVATDTFTFAVEPVGPRL